MPLAVVGTLHEFLLLHDLNGTGAELISGTPWLQAVRIRFLVAKQSCGASSPEPRHAECFALVRCPARMVMSAVLSSQRG
jgi:hypothetical protein